MTFYQILTPIHLTLLEVSSNESDLASRNGNNTPIDQILSNFNENYESVNGVIPNIYYFMDGINGSTIGDGGNDMYDGGNLLSTNLRYNH